METITLPQSPPAADIALAQKLQSLLADTGQPVPSIVTLLSLIERERITPCGPDCTAWHIYAHG